MYQISLGSKTALFYWWHGTCCWFRMSVKVTCIRVGSVWETEIVSKCTSYMLGAWETKVAKELPGKIHWEGLDGVESFNLSLMFHEMQVWRKRRKKILKMRWPLLLIWFQMIGRRELKWPRNNEKKMENILVKRIMKSDTTTLVQEGSLAAIVWQQHRTGKGRDKKCIGEDLKMVIDSVSRKNPF